MSFYLQSFFLKEQKQILGMMDGFDSTSADPGYSFFKVLKQLRRAVTIFLTR